MRISGRPRPLTSETYVERVNLAIDRVVGNLDEPIRGGIDLELRALQWFYGSWLPRSGYETDDPPAFESFIGRPFAHGTTYFELDAQVPVRPG